VTEISDIQLIEVSDDNYFTFGEKAFNVCYRYSKISWKRSETKQIKKNGNLQAFPKDPIGNSLDKRKKLMVRFISVCMNWEKEKIIYSSSDKLLATNNPIMQSVNPNYLHLHE
jgi:hypothetical protein